MNPKLLLEKFGLFIKQLVITSVKIWLDNDVAFKSAGLTYYAMFAFIPMMSLLITISTILVTESFIADEVNRYIASIFNEPVSTRLQLFVNDLVGSDFSLALTIGGAFAFLYAATSYFARLNQMTKMVAFGYQSHNQLLENLYQRFKGLMYAVVIFFFVAVLSAAQSLIDNIELFYPALEQISSLSVLVELVGIIVSLILLAFLLAAYYRSTLGPVASKSSTFVSALLVSLSIYLINIFLSYMLSFSATYQDYGIFSATLSVVIWTFLINTVLICGAGLTAAELMNRKSSN